MNNSTPGQDNFVGNVLPSTFNAGEQQKFDNLAVLKKAAMVEDYEKKKRKQVETMRTIRDYGIGIVVFLAGIFFFFRDHFELPFNERYPPDSTDKIIGVVCVVYGGWRIYRGYKKNYFK